MQASLHHASIWFALMLLGDLPHLATNCVVCWRIQVADLCVRSLVKGLRELMELESAGVRINLRMICWISECHWYFKKLSFGCAQIVTVDDCRLIITSDNRMSKLLLLEISAEVAQHAIAFLRCAACREPCHPWQLPSFCMTAVEETPAGWLQLPWAKKIAWNDFLHMFDCFCVIFWGAPLWMAWPPLSIVGFQSLVSYRQRLPWSRTRARWQFLTFLWGSWTWKHNNEHNGSIMPTSNIQKSSNTIRHLIANINKI